MTWTAVIAVLAAGLGFMAGDAWADWLPTVARKGPEIQRVTFDANDVPWAAFESEGTDVAGRSTPFIGRLTKDYRLADVHAIPRILENEIIRVDEMSVNSSGIGDVLLEYGPHASEQDKAPPSGVAIAAWHPGRSIGKPIELSGDVYRGPSMAINSTGTAVVLWVGLGQERVVSAARVKSGRLLGEQKIPIADGHVPDSMEVLSSLTGGFSASWQLRAGGVGLGAVEFQLVAVDNDRASRTGVFSVPAMTPWPIFVPGALGVSGASLVSDARGDQVGMWGATTEEATGRKEDIYVASLRAGGPFGPSQLIAEADEFGRSDSEVVIGPTVRITAIWQPTRFGEILAASGNVGHPLGLPHPVSRGGSGTSQTAPLVAVTSRGQVIAVWSAQRGTSNSTIMAATSDGGAHSQSRTAFR